MTLAPVEESLIVAAYFRGGSQSEQRWTSNSDQVLTLSLYYTGDITAEDCRSRFSCRSHVQELYSEDGQLTEEIEARYKVLIRLLAEHPELIEGGGNFQTPAFPTFTACRLTTVGLQLAERLIDAFPRKPDFSNWPDQRTMPEASW